MPDTLFLSTGVSLGLLAGIVSGVCYIIANGVTWPKNDREPRRLPPPRDICPRCGGDSLGGPVPCICPPHRPVKFESGAWFLRQVQRAASLMPWSISTEKLEQIEEECEGAEGCSPEGGRELRGVREFLEALSAKLAGGPLETASVAPLYDHPAYVAMFERHHPGIRDSLATLATALRDALSHLPPLAPPSSAHAQLKRLVSRVVEEAAALPALARYAAEPARTPESNTYEDLLATAILNKKRHLNRSEARSSNNADASVNLNKGSSTPPLPFHRKVIERYQTEGSGGRSSGIHSASNSPSPSDRSSPRSVGSRVIRDISPPLREEEDVSDWEEGTVEEALELRRAPFPDFSGDLHHIDNDERDFDEVSGSEIQPIDGSWEENWLFQKKKIKTIQSVPVPMLVPNSNTEYRAMIGDRDADDTTDLSDNASEAEEEEMDYKSDIKKVLDFKHVIGGAPKVEDFNDFEPDSLTIIDGSDDFEKIDEIEYMQSKLVDVVNNEVKGYDVNGEKLNGNINGKLDGSVLIVGVDSGPLTKAEFALKEEIHRTILNGNSDAYIEDLKTKEDNDAFKDGMNKSLNKSTGPTSTLSRHEREQEYEETVTLPVQRYADSLRRKHFEDDHQQIPTRDTDQEDDLIPGSIAYRERKKWLNFVEMPNNPYSPEAIQKRLSSKSTSSLFDTLTSKSKIRDDPGDVVDGKDQQIVDIPVKEDSKPSLNVSSEDIHMNGRRSKSPSPRILKDVLAEEIPQYKRYGRDYYLKEAKVSSGSRKKGSDASSISSMNKSTSLDNFDVELTTPGLLIKQFNSIASNQQYKTFAVNEATIKPVPKSEIMIEYEDINEQTLFSAKPVYLDEETDKKFEEILHNYETPVSVTTDHKVEEPQKSPSNLSIDNSYLSSSSLEDSIKIYNVQTGEIVKCKPEDNVSVSPRYETDRNDNIDISDKEEEVDSLSPSDVVIVENDVKHENLENISEIEEILAQLPKVKELAKKFVSMDNLSEPIKPIQTPPLKRQKSKDNLLSEKTTKLMYMHSLTARSISKEFRQELKMSMATPLKVPGGSKEIPEGAEVIIKESSRPGSPLPEPGTIKTKLAFFESLKNKFSSK